MFIHCRTVQNEEHYLYSIENKFIGDIADPEATIPMVYVLFFINRPLVRHRPVVKGDVGH